MKKNKLVSALITSSLIAFSSISFAQEDQSKNTLSPTSAKSIVETISILNSIYVDPMPSKDFEDKVISGILSKFDSHSSYLDSESLKNFEEEMNGKYAGLGMIAKRPLSQNYGVKIEELFTDGPAERAGLKEGDVIIKAGNKELNGSLSDNIKYLKGKAGTTVKITYLRNGETLETTVTRNFINTKSVFGEFCQCKGSNAVFLKIVNFNENTGIEAIENLSKHLEKNPSAIIIDLKDNPGGMLQASVELSSLFLKNESIVVSTKERSKGQTYLKVNQESIGESFWNKRQEFLKKFPNLATIPVYVMINSNSASASEILSAALKDNNRATLIGEKTFGKGSVQRMISLSNGGAIKITIARYYSPSGKTIQAEGVSPDIEVVDNRPWRVSVLDMQKKKYLEKTPTSFEREADLPGHLTATYKTNSELINEIETKISEENFSLDKSQPYEKRFSYYPISKDGKMDAITSRVVNEILKKYQEAKPLKENIKTGSNSKKNDSNS